MPSLNSAFSSWTRMDLVTSTAASSATPSRYLSRFLWIASSGTATSNLLNNAWYLQLLNIRMSPAEIDELLEEVDHTGSGVVRSSYYY